MVLLWERIHRIVTKTSVTAQSIYAIDIEKRTDDMLKQVSAESMRDIGKVV